MKFKHERPYLVLIIHEPNGQEVILVNNYIYKKTGRYVNDGRNVGRYASY